MIFDYNSNRTISKFSPMKSFQTNRHISIIIRIVLILIFAQFTRIWFYFYNQDLFSETSLTDFLYLCLNGIRFDLTAICYFNILYILLAVWPYPRKYAKKMRLISNITYGVINSIFLVIQIADIPFFRFTGTRTQAIHITEILQDNGIVNILAGHIGSYSGITFSGICFIALFLFLAFLIQPKLPTEENRSKKIIPSIVFVILIFGGTFIGMRGHIKRGKPISVADAAIYCKHNKEVALVLNTPFSIIRTIGKNNLLPRYEFYSAEEVSSLQNDIHQPSNKPFVRKNIILIILEGVGNSFIKAFNPYWEEFPTASHSLTPFLDSLSQKSLVFKNFYTTFRKSSSGITATLGGIPAFNPFIYILSPYQGNEVDTAASMLKKEGYTSCFFCGCNKGSYGFTALSKAFGYENFYDRISYENEFGYNKDHYDGHWGIYDHVMADVLLTHIERMREPFIVSWFTLNTHEPYTIPEEYQNKFDTPGHTMHQTVEYIDSVLANFFDKASKEPWFDNTIFLLTADHGHLTGNAIYDNSAQLNRIPFLIYAPDGTVQPGSEDRVGSQIDINPTILGLLNFQEPYFSFGENLTSENSVDNFALFDDQTDYIFTTKERMLRIDKTSLKPLALYRYKEDPMLSTDYSAHEPETVVDLCKKAIIFLQDYSNRVTNNRTSYKNE